MELRPAARLLTTPGREREDRRGAILASAVRAFAENGFYAARMSDIAQGAGIAEGTIYLYFGGKDDLLLTIFRDTLDAFCDAAGAIPAALPFVERITHFVELQFTAIEADPALATVLLRESRQSSKFFGGAVREALRGYAAAIDAMLTRGREQGAIRLDADLGVARGMLIGALEEIELEWLLGDRSRALVPQAARVADVFHRGLLPAAGHGPQATLS